MTLPFKNFATIVGNAAAAVQGSAEQLLDLTVGSTLRAMLEAHAGVALWLQCDRTRDIFDRERQTFEPECGSHPAKLLEERDRSARLGEA